MSGPDDRLTVADIVREYGVKPSRVWKWAQRGVLQPVGQALSGGRPAMLYRRHDVERVMRSTDSAVCQDSAAG